MNYLTPSEQSHWRKMGKDCYTLEEVKVIFGQKYRITPQFDWIFAQPSDKWRYAPVSFIYAMANPLPRDSSEKAYDPIIPHESEEVSELFGIDFDGESAPEVLCGEMRTDLLKDTRTFVVASNFPRALAAPHLLVKVTWGAKGHRGKERAYAKALGAIHFESVTNNSGRRGVDYWFLPWGIAKAEVIKVNQFRFNLATHYFPEEASSPLACEMNRVAYCYAR